MPNDAQESSIMSSRLRQALQHAATMPYRGRTIPPPRIVATAEKITQLYHGSAKQPAKLELDALYKRFLQASQQNKWDDITKSEWKKAPWLLWYASPFLVDQSSFMEKFHSALMASSNGRVWKRVIHVYLMHYGKHKENPIGEQQLAKWLQEACNAAALKDHLIFWRERNNSIGMFNDTSWLKTAAQKYLTDYNTNPQAYWKDFGLSGELETSGYSTAVGHLILRQIRTMLVQKPSLLNSAWHYVMKDEKTVRFPLLRKELIETLLEPWADVSSPADVRKALLGKLLTAFQDPRFRTAAGHWAGVSDTAKLVLRKWLAGVTIEQFFKIIDDIGQEEHWNYRRAFWKSYIDSQAVDDACVALGREGFAIARQTIEKDALAVSMLNEASPASCVLLIRIGDLVIAEFNHNGKCRFWRATHQNAPTLHADQYNDSRLRVEPPSCLEALSHGGSSTYAWQRKFRDFIRKHTGYQVRDHDFKVP